ncbi:phosphotransferase [Aureimonas sp. SK2]|uniref:phosphotransferase n=1 Tax=Aureimonas sp. SK2 TaxID=3015992 RepID=UPI0032601B35
MLSKIQALSDLSSPCARVSTMEACAHALELYGIQAQSTRFATEKDDTFRLDAADGGQYVLKIAHPSEAYRELDLQVAILRHLETVAPDLPVPRAFPDRRGAAIPEIETRSGERRRVRLMSFLPGTPLDSASSSREQRHRIGALSARLRLALADFGHPADTRFVAWDVQNLGSLAELLPYVTDATHRGYVARALSLFDDIRPKLERCRRQVLHNDMNTSNLVVDSADPDIVSGVIDFGDAVKTAIAIDVSTTLMNQMPKGLAAGDGIDPFEAPRDVVSGYLRHADLTEDELALIPFLALGRQATRALLTSWRASLFPDNAPYILRNTQAGWRHLAWFHSLSPQQIGDLLLAFRPSYRGS